MRWRVLWLIAAATLLLGVGGSGVATDAARRIVTSSGTALTVGAVSSGQYLMRSGGALVGASASGGAAIAPSSPYTAAEGVRLVTCASSCTVVLPALSTLGDGEAIRVISTSSTSITVTLDPPAGATIDGGSDGASLAITVGARGVVGAIRLTSSTWGSLQPGGVADGVVRSILVTGEGSALVAYEQVLLGTAWATVSTLALVEETTTCDLDVADGVITLPSGAAATSATQSQCYEVYVSLDASAAWDALLVTGGAWHLEMDATEIDTVANARLGCLVARTAGTALDAAGENFIAARVGYASGANNAWGVAGTGAAYSTAVSTSGTPALTALGLLGIATAPVQVSAGAAYAGSTTTLTTMPDRLYLTGGATSSSTGASAAFTGFECRLTLHAPEL